MTRPGVLSNPTSTRNRRDGMAIRGVVARHSGLAHIELHDRAEIAGALAEFAAMGIDPIVVNGGDGTLVRVLSELYNSQSYPKPPDLAIVASGNTNMIAGDVGLRGNRLAALDRLLGALEAKTPIPSACRHIVRVDSRPGMPAHYGMFFGAVAVCRGIDFVRAHFHDRGIKGAFADLAATAMTVWHSVMGEGALIAGETLEIAFDGAAPQRALYSAVLVSTLERLFFGLRPFWGQGPGALRFSSATSPPFRLLSALPRAMLGRPTAAMQANGWTSRNASEIRIAQASRFSLDGEVFDADPANPLVLSDAGEIRFLR